MADREGGPEPGWYADPAGEQVLRWWDGARWTDHTRDDPAAPTAKGAGRPTVVVAAAAAVALLVLGAVVFFLVRGGGDGRDVAADQELAETAALASADLPDGWSPAPGPAGPAGRRIDFGAEGCRHLQALDDRFADEPSAVSPTFEGPEGLVWIDNQVQVLVGRPEAASVIDDVADGATGECLEQVMREVFDQFLAEEPLLATAEISRVGATPLAPVLGDRAAGWRVAIDVDLGSGPATFFADLVVVQFDRSVADFVFHNAFEPFDARLQNEVVASVAERLRTGLGG